MKALRRHSMDRKENCMDNSDSKALISVSEEKVIRQYEKKAEKESGMPLSFLG